MFSKKIANTRVSFFCLGRKTGCLVFKDPQEKTFTGFEQEQSEWDFICADECVHTICY